MNMVARIIIAEVGVVMNPITIGHDVMTRSGTPKMMFNLERSTCTIENLGVNTHAMLTMLSCVHLKKGAWTASQGIILINMLTRMKMTKCHFLITS